MKLQVALKNDRLPKKNKEEKFHCEFHEVTRVAKLSHQKQEENRVMSCSLIKK